MSSINQGAKSLIPRMLRDINPSTTQYIMVMNNNVRSPMMRMVMRICLIRWPTHLSADVCLEDEKEDYQEEKAQ